MTSNYNSSKAETFWTKRVSEVDELRAVLSYGLPEYINQAYSNWELALLKRSIGDVRNCTILDLGCGVGRVTIELLKWGARVTGVDNSAKMLEITEGKVQALSLSGFTKVKSSANNLPLPSNSFDRIVCVGLLEHLPPDVRGETLEQILRLLRIGGCAYIVVNNESSSFLKSLYRMKEQNDDGYFVGIIGMEFLRTYFLARDAEMEILGSNACHSYVRHTRSCLGALENSDLSMRALMEIAMIVDLQGTVPLDLQRELADQFFVRMWKRG